MNLFLNPSFSEWHHSSCNISSLVLALIMYYINISLKQQMYHSRTLSEQSTLAVMYFIREAPSWAGQVQKQSQCSSTKGESLAHVRWHLTFGSSSRLSSEWNVHSCFYWTVETSSKSLDMVNLISGKQKVEWKSLWERTVCRQWIVQCCLFLGRPVHLGMQT